MALAILKAQPDRGRSYVFGDGPRGYKGFSQGKAELDLRAKIEPGWVLHDLRRTFSTRLNGEGIAQPHVVERLLGLHQGGIASVYNKASYLREMAQALALWSERVTAIVEQREAKVVPLRA
jgi:integrase